MVRLGTKTRAAAFGVVAGSCVDSDSGVGACSVLRPEDKNKRRGECFGLMLMTLPGFGGVCLTMEVARRQKHVCWRVRWMVFLVKTSAFGG